MMLMNTNMGMSGGEGSEEGGKAVSWPASAWVGCREAGVKGWEGEVKEVPVQDIVWVFVHLPFCVVS